MATNILISEDEFFSTYRPQINHILRAEQPSSVADEDIAPFGGTMYETYGEEQEYIGQLLKEGKNKHIWTILDIDGELIISAGASFVNRMGYIVTEKAWDDINETVEND